MALLWLRLAVARCQAIARTYAIMAESEPKRVCKGERPFDRIPISGYNPLL